MSLEIPIDKLISGLSNSQVGDNAQSILSVLKEVNTVLGEFKKTTGMLNNMGILPGIVRVVGKKYDVDMETPLSSLNSVIPNSDLHRQVFEQLNTMSEEQLNTWLSSQQVVKDAKDKSSGRKPKD